MIIFIRYSYFSFDKFLIGQIIVYLIDRNLRPSIGIARNCSE